MEDLESFIKVLSLATQIVFPRFSFSHKKIFVISQVSSCFPRKVFLCMRNEFFFMFSAFRKFFSSEDGQSDDPIHVFTFALIRRSFTEQPEASINYRHPGERLKKTETNSS